MTQPTSYWDYIKVEELLALQRGLAQSEGELANDEVVFIVVHQIDELWFKLVLRELVSIRDLFAASHVHEQSLSSAVRGIRRAASILGHATNHFALMETLTTRDYLAFRDKLSPASGFQSAQMREIEILMGLREDERIPLGHESYLAALRNADGSASPASERVERRLADRPCIRDAIEAWLFRTPIEGSRPDQVGDAERVAAWVEAYCGAMDRELEGQRKAAQQFALTDADAQRLTERYDRASRDARAYLKAEEIEDPQERARRSRVRAALTFIESYRELPLLAWPREVVDGIVLLEQAFTIFRQRHARMVERVIGRRTGTGGSAGVEYLDQTALRYRIFRDVWAVRTLLIRESALPPLANAKAYEFHDTVSGEGT